MDELAESIRTAAAQARMVMLRLAADGGVLHQIESGDWDDRLRRGSADLKDLIDAMQERARLDRIILDLFAPEGSGSVSATEGRP